MTEKESREAARDVEAEATGETVGEAKWAALRELEARVPGLDKASVEFVVLAEGERGLLGVGYVPAHVIARVSRLSSRMPTAAGTGSETERAALLRALLERIRAGLGVDASVEIHEDGPLLSGAFHGRDLGLLIGKHGQTIDAIQYLATAVIARTTGERVDVVVDAAGYRERRHATLEALADRTAAEVAATGKAVSLDPMTANERKAVHVRLKEHREVVTASEGMEPNRRVVVRPAE
jgi:spoIIIJ-associated protein